jgi:hypothetical protein
VRYSERLLAAAMGSAVSVLAVVSAIICYSPGWPPRGWEAPSRLRRGAGPPRPFSRCGPAALVAPVGLAGGGYTRKASVSWLGA